MISVSFEKIKLRCAAFSSLSVDIYDEDKDTTSDSTPVASAVATRATQMVELLSRDNVALREKLENAYLKMNNMQMVRKTKLPSKIFICNISTFVALWHF